MCKTFKVVYFAPYQSANFSCEAESIEQAVELTRTYHLENGYCVQNREIRRVKWDGKPITVCL